MSIVQKSYIQRLQFSRNHITVFNTIKFCILLYTLQLSYTRLKQFNELRKVIKLTQSSNTLSSIYKTIRVLYISLVSVVNQRLYGSTNIGKNISYVSYFHSSKWYYFPIISKRGPKKIIDRVNDDEENDITEFITKLAGPNVDFYGYKIRPKDINYKRLIVIIDNEEKIFEEEDYISI